MAEISLDELYKIITSHPDYYKWWAGVDANHALYIRFSSESEKVSCPESDTFETKDGRMLVIDRLPDGLVYGIEIV